MEFRSSFPPSIFPLIEIETRDRAPISAPSPEPRTTVRYHPSLYHRLYHPLYPLLLGTIRQRSSTNLQQRSNRILCEMVIIRSVMTALSATLLIRRCVGGASSAFVSQSYGMARRSLSHRSFSRQALYQQNNAFVSPSKYTRFSITSLAMSTTAPQTDTSTLAGIDWVRSSVVTTLNNVFDPVEIAKGGAVAKLDGKKKKKKKKKADDEAAEEEEPTISPEEREAIISAAVANAKPFGLMDAMVTPATKPEFGDYQCNAAMSLSKSAGLNPRDCASKIVDGLKSIPSFDSIMEEPEIAGPGFINLRFKDEYLADAAKKMAQDSQEGGRLAVPKTASKQKIIVDFSSPNIAKEMHVGHLRSTIIGDTLSNLLTFAGHDVLRLNHVGDWGTQFGMLVEHLRDEFPEALDKETSKNVDLGDLVTLYKAAKKRFDDDAEFKVRAREGVVKLQAGDKEALAAWESLCAASRVEYQKVSLGALLRHFVLIISFANLLLFHT